MKSTLTNHAFDRVSERLHLTPEEVAAILDSGETLPLGHEPGTDRVHLLFYSDVDEQCFIAVRDTHTGEVITIFPPDFENRFRFSLQALSRFENNRRRGISQKSVSDLLPPKELDIPAISPENMPVFRFTVYFRRPLRGTRRTKTMKLSSSKYGTDIMALSRNVAVQQLLKEFITKNMQDLEVFDGIFVKLGTRSASQSFDFVFES